jgi:hypothetical protein
MSLGNKVESVDRRNNASGLSDDVIAYLQGQIAEGSFGTGVSPLQREAGTAIRQVVNSGGLSPEILDAVNRTTNRQAGDLREGFGIAGSRFGTPLAIGEGILRSDAATNVANIGSERLLAAIQMMQQFGGENLAPFIQLASLGILPPQLVEKPGILSTLGSIFGVFDEGSNIIDRITGGRGVGGKSGGIPSGKTGPGGLEGTGFPSQVPGFNPSDSA